jgi:hypothetical protein
MHIQKSKCIYITIIIPYIDTKEIDIFFLTFDSQIFVYFNKLRTFAKFLIT